ncbi:MAG TPA: hypothetical protein VG826_22670 [Pirellulales bacterium]|nr:hypothetical protein [Pirellulales bacterium]
MILYPQIPSDFGCEVVGYLYDSDDPADLGQTMMEIVTPKGVCVNCGWLPEGDPNGAYRIVVTQGFRRVMRDYETRSIEEAARRLEAITKSLCVGVPFLSSISGAVRQTVNFALPAAKNSVEVSAGRPELAIS